MASEPKSWTISVCEQCGKQSPLIGISHQCTGGVTTFGTRAKRVTVVPSEDADRYRAALEQIAGSQTENAYPWAARIANEALKGITTVEPDEYDWDTDPTAQDVIDALRITDVAKQSDAEMGRMARLLIDWAPESLSDRGTSFLMRLISEATLKIAMIDPADSERRDDYA